MRSGSPPFTPPAPVESLAFSEQASHELAQLGIQVPVHDLKEPLEVHAEKTGEEHPAPMELVRMAMPRRVYTQSHVDYMIESIRYMTPHLESLKGFAFTYQSKYLRHFTARFKKLS
jgi:tryptophanase